jgi:hypothetical protein
MNNDVEFDNLATNILATNIANPISASGVSDLNRLDTAVRMVILIIAMVLTIFSISYALHESRLGKPYHRLTKQNALKTESASRHANRKRSLPWRVTNQSGTTPLTTTSARSSALGLS